METFIYLISKNWKENLKKNLYSYFYDIPTIYSLHSFIFSNLLCMCMFGSWHWPLFCIPTSKVLDIKDNATYTTNKSSKDDKSDMPHLFWIMHPTTLVGVLSKRVYLKKSNIMSNQKPHTSFIIPINSFYTFFLYRSSRCRIGFFQSPKSFGRNCIHAWRCWGFWIRWHWCCLPKVLSCHQRAFKSDEKFGK